ncbi:MAG: hypothetical protein AB7K24_22285 [Gemmataceae bacterium]
MRRMFITATILTLYGMVSVALAEDTPAAAAARKKLEVKVKVNVENEFLSEILADIDGQLDDAGKTKIGWKFDTGVSKNQRVSIKASGTIAKVLADICDKQGLGYYVISKPKDRYDGWIIFTKGKERGFEDTKKE